MRSSSNKIYFIVYLGKKPVSFGVAEDVDEFERRRENIECLSDGIRVVKVGKKLFKRLRRQILEGEKKDFGRLKVSRRDLNGCCRCRG
jgi:hypothetical protein